MSRCRSFLPDLMTVRAVMVRVAMEKKKLLAASHVIRCGGGTDNKAASAITNRRLSTKLPLMIILMEYWVPVRRLD